MKPVKIKYWGFIWLTKSGYLLLNGIGWLVVLILAVVCVYGDLLPPFSTLWRQDPRWGLFNYFWWLVLACMACQVIDAGVTWLKFAKKEEEQRRLEEAEWAEAEDDWPEPERSEAVRARPTDFRRPRDP